MLHFKRTLATRDKAVSGEGRNGSSYFAEEEKQPVKLIKEKEQVGKDLEIN